MTLDYSLLITGSADLVSESKQCYTSLMTERHVQVMWLEQKYFKDLKTCDGKSVEVISPGIWNVEAGPDFKKAHLAIDDKEYFGDIEIHLSDEGWVQHNHDQDRRYNNVILHLSFWKAKRHREVMTSEGTIIPRAYFEDFLTVSEKRIISLIDLDLYPYKKFCGAGKCANTLFRKLPTKEIEGIFRSAAEWRLKKKREHLQFRINDPRLHFEAGLAMALGYKQNSEAFLELFLLMSKHRSLDQNDLTSLALGYCGFFLEHYQKMWGESRFYQELSERYEALVNTDRPKVKLVLSNIRPLNHPVRRIAYLVHMIKDRTLPQLYQRMEAHWEASWPLMKTKKDINMLYQELIAMLPSYEDAFWNYHYTFETTIQKKYFPLVGNSLKGEALTNTFFPFLHESISSRGIPQELDAFLKLFAVQKAQNTGKAKYLKHRFFGDTDKGKIITNADTLQGAYQLHHDFCIHYEASCEGCPFVERYTLLI